MLRSSFHSSFSTSTSSNPLSVSSEGGFDGQFFTDDAQSVTLNVNDAGTQQLKSQD